MSYFWYVWFAHIVYTLVIQESQVNEETLRCHEAHRRFSLSYAKTIL